LSLQLRISIYMQEKNTQQTDAAGGQYTVIFQMTTETEQTPVFFLILNQWVKNRRKVDTTGMTSSPKDVLSKGVSPKTTRLVASYYVAIIFEELSFNKIQIFHELWRIFEVRLKNYINIRLLKCWYKSGTLL
jgi:hypothetical protein